MLDPNLSPAELADRYLHDLLTPEEAAEFRRRAESDSLFSEALRAAQARQAKLKSVAAEEPSQLLIQRTAKKVDDRAKRGSRLKWLANRAIAATLLLAVCLGGSQWYVSALKASPTSLEVLGQSSLVADSVASLRVRVTEHGRVLAGVPVSISLVRPDSQIVELASFTTDAAGGGVPSFRLPDMSGQARLRVVAQTSRGTEVFDQSVTLRRSAKVLLSSDKPVYQPGQTIHLRALGLSQATLKPLAKAAGLILVSDPKSNVIFKQAMPASEYGIISADCPLAEEIIEGNYTITAQIGDTSSRLTVEVKRYVLPKFRVKLELDKPFYTPGGTIRGTLSAQYYFGKPVAKSEVLLKLSTDQAGPQVIETKTVRTDEDGQAEFTLGVPARLVGRAEDGGLARIALTASVTDSAGQSASAFAGRMVASQPVRVIAIPEGGGLVPGLVNRVYLFVSSPDGQPLRRQVTARLNFADAQTTTLQTNDFGIAVWEVTGINSQTTLSGEVLNAQGQLEGSWKSTLWPANKSDFILRTDRAVYEGGQTLNLTILAAGSGPVYVDVLKDNQTIRTEVVNVQNGRGTTAFDIPADWQGTLRLVAYRTGSAVVTASQSRVFYVRPARQLKIATQLDSSEYRPGQKAKVLFSLSDSTGQPVVGALSLAVVDEAVFDVLEQAPGMESTFFTLEKQLLEPVYAIYNWSPEAGPVTPPREDFDYALLSRTTLSGAQPHTLTGETYTPKVQEVNRLREEWQKWIRLGWILLLTGAGCLTFGLLLIASSSNPVLMISLSVGGGLVALILTIASLGTQARSVFQEVATAVGFPMSRDMKAGGRVDKQLKSEDRGEADDEVNVRERFPETLLWKPELITDEKGRASLEMDLADSITTWRMSLGAVSADGRLGGEQVPIKVFQPFFVDFNLPVALTRNDEVTVNVIVYNYTPMPQQVELKLAKAAWFDLLEGEAVQTVSLVANEVKRLGYRVRVKTVGTQTLEVVARAGQLADAVRRKIEVVPDGQRVESVSAGMLDSLREMALTIPPEAIEGSPRAILRLYPNTLSQLTDGLENIFRMPYGCFEQTSSTTYPNVLTLSYLKSQNQASPSVEAKARQYIHLGYQRLVSFEVAGGGFSWFGNAPANRKLTAYGLLEFQDMAKVHEVDPKLIERTRSWLLNQRRPDGSWQAEWQEPGRGRDPNLSPDVSATAYVAWAVFQDKPTVARYGQATRDYLLRQRPEAINSTYVLALIANALALLDDAAAKPYRERLLELKKVSEDGKLIWWEPTERTVFYGRGQAGGVEATAMAVLAFQADLSQQGVRSRALAWIASQRDPSGTWYSTQATVLALKALLTGPVGGKSVERRIELRLGDHNESIVIPADQADVVRQVDLSSRLKPGAQTLTLAELGNGGIGYQLAWRYHLPEVGAPPPAGPLSIDLDYERADLLVGDTMKARCRVVNQSPESLPMVMLDLPIPPGFAVDPDEFSKLVKAQQIAKFQLTSRQVIVYLTALPAGQPLELAYTLRATSPVRVTTPGAVVYEYYDPSKRANSRPRPLAIRPR